LGFGVCPSFKGHFLSAVPPYIDTLTLQFAIFFFSSQYEGRRGRGITHGGGAVQSGAPLRAAARAPGAAVAAADVRGGHGVGRAGASGACGELRRGDAAQRARLPAAPGALGFVSLTSLSLTLRSWSCSGQLGVLHRVCSALAEPVSSTSRRLVDNMGLPCPSPEAP
jgi:hypothetical protein